MPSLAPSLGKRLSRCRRLYRESCSYGTEYVYDWRWPLRCQFVRSCETLVCVATVTWLLLSLGQFGLCQTPSRGSVDWILVLDTSASMHGADGSANIFTTVQDTLVNFIRETREGDTVTLYTFDRDVVLRSELRINGEFEKTRLINTVTALQSPGNRTYTGQALHDALEQANALKNARDARDRRVAIVLFTDGKEDVRGIPNPIRISSNLVPSEDAPFVFYVSLGANEHDQELENFVRGLGSRGQVFRDPQGTNLAAEANNIRATLESPVPPKEANLRVTPQNLDFGQIEPGDKSKTQAIMIHSDVDLRAHFVVDDQANTGIRLVGTQQQIDLKGNEDRSITLGLQSPSQLKNGAYSVNIVLSPDLTDGNIKASSVSVVANVRLMKAPLWIKFIKWLLVLLILIAVAIVIVSLLMGEWPWVWIPEWLRGWRPRLEGELEIIKPRPASFEDAYISLTQREVSRVLLSTLLPAGNRESDAELKAIKKKGQLTIELKHVKGQVQVNQIGYNNTEIYDGDRIELDDTTLQFNWTGHERQIHQPVSDDSSF